MDSSRRQILFTIIGESVVFIFLFFFSCLLLLVEVIKGQDFGLVPNLVLIVIIGGSSLGTQFSFVLFNHRELLVSTLLHAVTLESQLSNGK
jgi:hypothetical protein